MPDRSDIEEWVVQALLSRGGRARINQVAEHIWRNHKRELERSDYFYSWQYEYRWAATRLRHQGRMKSASVSPRGIWELST